MIQDGISFDNIHSYYDLNLVLSKVDIPPAQPKTSYVDIPGGDGSIDLTEAHGEVKFFDRDCKFTFTMNPASDLSESAFEEKKTEVSNALAGKQCKITLDKDNEFYYLGRCTVDSFASDKRIRQIVVSAKVQPYKYKQNETVVTFKLPLKESTVNIMCARKSVIPVIECDCPSTVQLLLFRNDGNVVVSLENGIHKYTDIQFTEGINRLMILDVMGNDESGTVTFRFQEGVL